MSFLKTETHYNTHAMSARISQACSSKPRPRNFKTKITFFKKYRTSIFERNTPIRYHQGHRVCMLSQIHFSFITSTLNSQHSTNDHGHSDQPTSTNKNCQLAFLEIVTTAAAAATKSLQSCLTLCNPTDSSPPGSSRPWDSPGKNTGVGCHFLFQCMKVKSESEVAQSCLTLRDPMDCSPPGSSVHGICQARVLEWGAIAFFTSMF